jgi:hypothetical protein
LYKLTASLNRSVARRRAPKLSSLVSSDTQPPRMLLSLVSERCQNRWQILRGLAFFCLLSMGITMSACGGGRVSTGPGVSTEPGIAELKTPSEGATGVSQFEEFTWNRVPDALAYLLIISPTSFGAWDMYNESFVPSVSRRYVWGLLPNTYYYAKLCTQKSSGWGCSTSNFITGSADPPPDRQTFYQMVQGLTSQVRLMTQGMTNYATVGTPLYQEMIDHGQNPNLVNCTYYAYMLLDLLTANKLLGRYRTISLDGLEVHAITEYWDPFNEKWEVADPTFGLVYFDPNSQMGQGAEDVGTLLRAGNLSAITPLFVTDNGSAFMTNYYMDPITLFNNPYPFGSNETVALFYNYVPNSPLPFLSPSSLGVEGTWGIYVFQFANQTDSITINNAGELVTLTPQNSEGWVGTLILLNGWFVTSPVPPGMNMYTFKRVMF